MEKPPKRNRPIIEFAASTLLAAAITLWGCGQVKTHDQPLEVSNERTKQLGSEVTSEEFTKAIQDLYLLYGRKDGLTAEEYNRLIERFYPKASPLLIQVLKEIGKNSEKRYTPPELINQVSVLLGQAIESAGANANGDTGSTDVAE